MKMIEDKKITVQGKVVNAGCFSFMISDEEYAILNKLDMLEWKTTLDGKADFALGIVTGNNKKYISTEKCQGNEMVLKGTDIYKYEFRKAENYLAFRHNYFSRLLLLCTIVRKKNYSIDLSVINLFLHMMRSKLCH